MRFPFRNPRFGAVSGSFVGQISIATEAMCRYQRLAQAEATISGGHLRVGEYLKTGGLQASLQLFAQETVVEAPATQANTLQPCALA